ncbi:MAG: DcrB-related protein [Thermoplasmatota archaeon]
MTGFRAPAGGAADTFAANINVVVTDLPSGTTLQDDWAREKQAMPTAVSGFSEIGEAATTAGGEPGMQIEYTGNLDANHLHWLQTVLVHAGREYVFTYTSLDGHQDEHRSEAAASLASLTFFHGSLPVQTGFPAGTNASDRRLTSQSAYELDLVANDLGIGWMKGTASNYTDNSPGVQTAHKAEPDRDPNEGDPFDIETTVRVFNTSANAHATYVKDKAKVENGYSTAASQVGDEAFAWQKAAPFVALEVRQGNVVWTIHFSGQAGYSWNPTLSEVGTILTSKYAA